MDPVLSPAPSDLRSEIYEGSFPYLKLIYSLLGAHVWRRHFKVQASRIGLRCVRVGKCWTRCRYYQKLWFVKILKKHCASALIQLLKSDTTKTRCPAHSGLVAFSKGLSIVLLSG